MDLPATLTKRKKTPGNQANLPKTTAIGMVFGAAPSLQWISPGNSQQPPETTCQLVGECSFFLYHRGLPDSDGHIFPEQLEVARASPTISRPEALNREISA